MRSDCEYLKRMRLKCEIVHCAHTVHRANKGARAIGCNKSTAPWT